MDQTAFVDFLKVSPQPGTPSAFFTLGHQYIWTIASDADDREVRLMPSVSVETSRGRRNVYWRLTEPVSYLNALSLLAYLDPISPPRLESEWRLPGQRSTKREKPFAVEVVPTLSSMHVISPAQIMALPPPETACGHIPSEWVNHTSPFGDVPARGVLAADKSSHLLLAAFDNAQADLTRFIASLWRRNFSEREVIWIISESALGKVMYSRWKYGILEDLAKLILVARVSKASDAILRQINAIRGDTNDKRRSFEVSNDVAKVALKDFQSRCSILHAADNSIWAVEKLTGNAMELGVGNSPLQYFITRRYGINPVDKDHKYLIKAMEAYADALPKVAHVASMSSFNPHANQMTISFGGREVVSLSAKGMAYEENGANGTIIQTVGGAQPIATRLLPVDRALDKAPGAWWADFMPLSHMINLSKGKPEEVNALLHVWTVFTLFRDLATARPILTFLGAMGSGKSTASRKLHLLLYGKGVDLFDLSEAEHWDTARSNYPLTIWDNIDAPTPRWFPVALARSTSPIQKVKRRLYSNNEPYTVLLDSVVGLSAHDADFLREDIIDRMLLIQYRRFEKWERLEETPMLEEVVDRREEYLAGLMADVVNTLRTPRMKLKSGSDIRVADFAGIGQWIATALGIQEEFMSSLKTLAAQQTFQILEEDALLVDAIVTLKQQSPKAQEWLSAPQLWMEMVTYADDGGDALKRLYRNPSSMSRKLAAISQQISSHLGVETKEDFEKGRSVWRMTPPGPLRPPREETT